MIDELIIHATAYLELLYELRIPKYTFMKLADRERVHQSQPCNAPALAARRGKDLYVSRSSSRVGSSWLGKLMVDLIFRRIAVPDLPFEHGVSMVSGDNK